jgi:Fur family iron response transcriptional regulator
VNGSPRIFSGGFFYRGQLALPGRTLRTIFADMPDFNAPLYLDDLGLRATRPRVTIARILFADGVDRHITAEWLADELGRQGEPVALATVYNTLHSLTDAGVLREVHGTGHGTTIFDTNTEPHHHFYDAAAGRLTDIPEGTLTLVGVPDAPDGKTIDSCEIIIRLR